MRKKRDPLSRLRHDLRTPINQIVGYAELIKEEAEDDGHAALTPDLDRVIGAAKTLLALIDENMTGPKLAALLAGEDAAGPVAPAAAPPSNAADASLAGLSPAPLARPPDGHGRILIVDDNRQNCEVLARRLDREGHETAIAGDGLTALARLAAEPYDLVLLDILMPGLDGHTVLARMKLDSALRHIPVIMISAVDEMETVVRCIEIGAEDYLPKPFDPVLLRARIGASLEKKALRDAEQRHLRTIESTQSRLASELAEAAAYVRSTLPAPIGEGPVRTDWRMIPSTELGGDAFGYHWVDPDHFACYLLDVCGHGVGAALLSATAIKVLLSEALPDVDFRDAGAVLTALNEQFLMEEQNNMYFTIWYGVFDRRSRTLTSASAGHPPSLLVAPGGGAEPVGGKGMLLGGFAGTVYRSSKCELPPGAKLFLVSDGAYEIQRAGKSVLDFTGLARFLSEAAAQGEDELERLVAFVRRLHGEGSLDDDLSILKVSV